MQKTKENTGLVWFTNNLRVQDNESLSKACQFNDRVIALYCFDPRHFQISSFGFKKTEKYRSKFLIESIVHLKKKLKDLNISLLVYLNFPEEIIPTVCEAYNVDNLYYQEEWTKEEVEVINKVKNASPKSTVVSSYYSQFLFHPEDVYKIIKDIPNVFTVFRKKAEKYINVQLEFSIKRMSKENLIENNTDIPELNDLGFTKFTPNLKSAFPFSGGELEAIKRLNYYILESKKIGVYKKTRNGLIGTDFSSKFSPWLANGSLSAKTIYWKIMEFEKENFRNESTYWLIFELIWRDYFKYISMKFGDNIFKVGGILSKFYPWRIDKTDTDKWINGKTTEPFVNANMIELKETGWMSNRGRQNVASYFSKELELDWRIGAAYFESMLIDYDVHSNYGNWMYVSGVGNDPRDRKFNIKSQAERYDANNKYRNMWLQTSLF